MLDVSLHMLEYVDSSLVPKFSQNVRPYRLNETDRSVQTGGPHLKKQDFVLFVDSGVSSIPEEPGGQRSIPEGPGGRRPTWSAPQWWGSSIFFFYALAPESLSRTKVRRNT